MASRMAMTTINPPTQTQGGSPARTGAEGGTAGRGGDGGGGNAGGGGRGLGGPPPHRLTRGGDADFAGHVHGAKLAGGSGELNRQRVERPEGALAHRQHGDERRGRGDH